MIIMAMNMAQAQTILRAPSNMSVSPGDQFTVSIEALNAPPMLSYFFRLHFSDQVEFLSAQEGALTAGWGVQYGTEANTVSVGGFSSVPTSGSGALARLRFRAKTDAPNGHVSPLTFEAAELNDGVLPLTTQEGSVRISRMVVVRLPLYVRPGPGDEMALAIIAVDGAEILSYYLQFSYNSGLLEFLGVSPGTAMPTGWGVPETHLSLNRVTLAGFGLTALSGTTRLATLHFRVRPETPFWTDTWVAFEAAEFNDGLFTAVTEDAFIEIIDPSALPVRGVWILALILGILAAIRGRRAMHVTADQPVMQSAFGGHGQDARVRKS